MVLTFPHPSFPPVIMLMSAETNIRRHLASGVSRMSHHIELGCERGGIVSTGLLSSAE